MIKVYNIFKKYYLLYLVIFFITILIFLYANSLDGEIIRIEIYSTIVILGTVLFGTVDLLMIKYYKPWKVKNMINKSPLKEFIKHGFVKAEEGMLYGSIDEYFLFVGSFWNEYSRHSTVFYQILFNAKKEEQLLSNKEYNLMDKKLKQKNVLLTLNSVVKEYSMGIFYPTPNYPDMLNDINESINFLRTNSLLPIKKLDWKNQVPEMEKYSRTLQNFSY